MPNTPARLGRGMTVWYATPETTQDQREQAAALLRALGHELEVDDERFVLGPGDALTFGAAVPHTWRNASDTDGARILWILAPALPDPRKEAS